MVDNGAAAIGNQAPEASPALDEVQIMNQKIALDEEKPPTG